MGDVRYSDERTLYWVELKNPLPHTPPPTPEIKEFLRPWSVITDLSTLILGTHYGLGFIIISAILFRRLVAPLVLFYTFVFISWTFPNYCYVNSYPFKYFFFKNYVFVCG